MRISHTPGAVSWIVRRRVGAVDNGTVVQVVLVKNLCSLNFHGARSVSVNVTPLELRALVRILEVVPPSALEELHARVPAAADSWLGPNGPEFAP
ncbi:MAG: hypothetical protein M0Z33_02115 [Actinomycetota bacterium]|nr:hypothetical protein [Actinomycetota bacterium]